MSLKHCYLRSASMPLRFYDYYKDIQNQKPFSFREKLRGYTLDALSMCNKIRGIEHQLVSPRVQFIYIHHIFKDEEKKFELLIERLAKHHFFIDYASAVEKILEGKIDRPYISLSFDDGFKNNMNAAAILERYGIKACFFINPSIIATTSFTEIELFCKEKLETVPIEFLNWEDVALLQKQGHEIGSHTMEHTNVANFDKNAFEEDCFHSFEILNKHCGSVKHFSFPYGRFYHFNEIAAQSVFNAGYYSCATAERGCHINPEKPLNHTQLCIRRDHVIVDWNPNHIFYFLSRNVVKANSDNNLFP